MILTFQAVFSQFGLQFSTTKNAFKMFFYYIFSWKSRERKPIKESDKFIGKMYNIIIHIFEKSCFEYLMFC